LALNLAYVEFGDDGLKVGQNQEGGFSRVIEKVNLALSSRKQNRFEKALRVSEHWREDSFTIDISYEGRDSCISCKKLPEIAERLCVHCRLDRDIGSIIPDAKYLAFFDSEAGMIPVLGRSVSILKSWPSNFEHTKPYLAIKLNDPDLTDITMYPAISKYLATFVAMPDDCEICKEAKSPVATFECIAQRSEGVELLGFLKADVDRLGESFTFGLKSETVAMDSISHVSTLSSMLDLFFSGWIERLTRESGDMYTVFSGGDDLFLVGPWDRILDIVERIKADFAKFTGNPSLTISAGIAIAKHDFPIANAAQTADAAREQFQMFDFS